jgi:minor histocompatibility antigen H13
MVTVAKSLDGPIKILFPRSLVPDATTGKLEMSLLGLGDIVIPGFFLALLLRFDAHLANLPVFPTDLHVPFPKPYFHSALFGYVIGLATTLYVMIGKSHLNSVDVIPYRNLSSLYHRSIVAIFSLHSL